MYIFTRADYAEMMKRPASFIGNMGCQSYDDVLAHYAEYRPEKRHTIWQTMWSWLSK